MLARGMQRNAERDLLSDEEWKRRKAQRILADLDSAVADALHDWITNLLKKPENSTRNFKATLNKPSKISAQTWMTQFFGLLCLSRGPFGQFAGR